VEWAFPLIDSTRSRPIRDSVGLGLENESSVGTFKSNKLSITLYYSVLLILQRDLVLQVSVSIQRPCSGLSLCLDSRTKLSPYSNVM